MTTPSNAALLAGGALLVLLLGLSALEPFDRTTWWLETAPIFAVVPLLVATHRSYPLTTLLYALVFLHAVVLMVGGHYSYARVPAGFWVENALGLSRNPYDKLGHLMQGFVPTLAAREVLLRGAYVRGRGMLAFLLACIALAISALYELAEWASAVALGSGADEFLGTQGDPWDTQSDMFCALLGSLACLALLPRWHDRQLGLRAPA